MFYLLWWLLRAFSVDTWGSSFSKVSDSFVKRLLWLKCVWIEKSLQKIQNQVFFFDGPLFFTARVSPDASPQSRLPLLHEQRLQPIRLKYAQSERFLVQWEVPEGGTSLDRLPGWSPETGKPGLTSHIPEDWNTWKQWLIRGEIYTINH